MYAYFNGVLTAKSGGDIVLEVGGIGYLIHMPQRMQNQLPELGELCKIHTSFQVRENTQDLYGFVQESEKRVFELLLLVSGVGPKVALNLLEFFSPEDFALAVIQGDAKRLSKAKGIGQKSAERLILELKDRIAQSDLATGETVKATSPESAPEDLACDPDVLEALMVLGFRRAEAKLRVEETYDPEASLEDNVRRALAFRRGS